MISTTVTSYPYRPSQCATDGPATLAPDTRTFNVVSFDELAWTECGIKALSDSGLSGGEQFDSILVLVSHVRNLAQQTITTGVTEDDINQALAEILTTEADRFPSLAAAMRSAAGSENQGLEFGLDRILDGLELLISERKG